jgi:UDP-N-acetylmuramoyl-tripeptide--D-alanyl-D-alanine ligase
MVLWTARDAAAATGGTATGNWVANGVSIDTRTIEQDDLFVALKAVRDGHDFVGMALEKGAAAALVTHRPDDVADDAPLLIVNDVLVALEALGRAARARTKAIVVGITGSVGKTSTKEMLRAVLTPQGITHAAEASYNNHWGVPLTLARMPANTEFAILEIGMSNPGEISPLAQMAQLDVAMVTTVAAAHLEAFDNIEGIAVEKAAIIDGLKPNGTAVINADFDTTQILQNRATKAGVARVLFGQMAQDWHLTDVRLSDQATIIQARHNDKPILFKLGCPGRHFAMNALGVLAVVDAMGADPIRAALDISNWAPPGGRGTRETVIVDPGQENGSFDLLDDAFNANPTSMEASLEVLAASTPIDNVGHIIKGRRIAVLGDMLELGENEVALHAILAENDHLAQVDLVHCAGPRMKTLFDALPEKSRGRWTRTAQELADAAMSLVDAGDVVLVKGSKGSKVSLVVDALRKLGHPKKETS